MQTNQQKWLAKMYTSKPTQNDTHQYQVLFLCKSWLSIDRRNITYFVIQEISLSMRYDKMDVELTRETPPEPNSHIVFTFTSATSKPVPTCSVHTPTLVTQFESGWTKTHFEDYSITRGIARTSMPESIAIALNTMLSNQRKNTTTPDGGKHVPCKANNQYMQQKMPESQILVSQMEWPKCQPLPGPF